MNNEKSVFAVYNVAGLEGQRPVVPHRIFTHRRTAVCYIDGMIGGPVESGTWKPDDTTWTYLQLPLYSDIQSAVVDDLSDIRARALAKLDSVERRALGV